MFRHIVVPVDGSVRSFAALGPAGRLADALGLELDVVSACPMERVAAREVQVKEALDQHGVTARVVSVVDSDDPVTAIGDHLRGTPDALLVMSTHGHTGVEALLLGSVAERLLRSLDVPILLLGPHHDDNIPGDGPVLAATDGSMSSLEVLGPLVDLVGALPEPPRVWSVAVSAPTDFGLASQMPGDDVDESAAVRRAAARLEAALGDTVDWDVLHATKPAAALVDAARRRSATMIAMATHGRSGLARVALGSVTMATVRHAPCPVLVVRPPRLRDR